MTLLVRFIKRHTYTSIFVLGCNFVLIPLVYERIIAVEYQRQVLLRNKHGKPQPWTLAETVMGMWWCAIRDQKFAYQRDSCVVAGGVLMAFALGFGLRNSWHCSKVNSHGTNPEAPSD
jgi:hypothetical protein